MEAIVSYCLVREQSIRATSFVTAGASKPCVEHLMAWQNPAGVLEGRVEENWSHSIEKVNLHVPYRPRQNILRVAIGAAEVTRHLADILNAPATLSGFSRLVVDCNRAHDDPTAMRQISDGTIVPGNRGLGATARALRANSCYWPYHRAATGLIDEVAARGETPAVISIHTCTPVMRDFERPWHVGVLSNHDRRMADLLIAELARDSTLCVGDNQPYSGLDPHGYTIETHALPHGRPNVLLEIRQDLVDTQHGARHWAELVGQALANVMAQPEIASAIGADVREAS